MKDSFVSLTLQNAAWKAAGASGFWATPNHKARGGNETRPRLRARKLSAAPQRPHPLREQGSRAPDAAEHRRNARSAPSRCRAVRRGAQRKVQHEQCLLFPCSNYSSFADPLLFQIAISDQQSAKLRLLRAPHCLLLRSLQISKSQWSSWDLALPTSTVPNCFVSWW